MANVVISATEFKAKCLALLDQVAEEGGTITITKRGKAVAELSRAKPEKKWKSPAGVWAGKVTVEDYEEMKRSIKWKVLEEVEVG